MQIKQSVCVPMVFPEAELNSALFTKIKAMGYQAVEFWNRESIKDCRTVFKTIRETGLQIATIAGHNSLPDGMNDLQNHDRIERELQESLEFAVEFDIAGLICFSGNRNGSDSDFQGMRNCAKILRKMAPQAEKAGVNLNMELLNSKIDHPGYQCDSSQWGFALCDMVGSTRVKLLFDIYHMQVMEGDIIRTIQSDIDYIGHFHTAGIPGRGDMDETQELNYSAIARAIDNTNYPYFVGHEYQPKADAMDSLKATFNIFS